MTLKTVAIKALLSSKAREDLAGLYNPSMEVQVNVAQDNGERIDGDYKGHRWHGWTDGLTTWKSFRIPLKANTEPEYTDSDIQFDLAEHTEAIGMTGWDWKALRSRWVAYDFDAIAGHSDKHSKKLTSDELEGLRETLEKLSYVTIRRSTGGKGLHIYVMLDGVPTANHSEHSALARAILQKMAAEVGYDFVSKVDVCGANMWVWHRKMDPETGLVLIKRGCTLTDIPANWRDHIKVVTGHRRKNLPQILESRADDFTEMCGQRPRVELDDQHKQLIDWLRTNNAFWWWDQDNHMLVTHTGWLKQAHVALQLKGLFNTTSDCSNLNEQNCFAFPMRRGAWNLRRFTPGCAEAACWEQDGTGWTKIIFNKDPDLQTACRTYGGLENVKGGFVFREAEVALKVLSTMGASINLNPHYISRETVVKAHKDGRIIVSLERKDNDRADEMEGWLPQKDEWLKIIKGNAPVNTENEVSSYDDMIRHLITATNEDSGWAVHSDGWRLEPLSHVKAVLAAQGLKANDVTSVIGNAVLKPWKLVNLPFQPEYPGDREWNLDAAQLKYRPTTDRDELSYPTWMRILSHVGQSLDAVVKGHAWCKANGILKGSDYLKCWIASMFQQPDQPLPYLFLYNMQQSTGKSILHEAIGMLLTKGCQRVDNALVSQSGFNEEMRGAILCVIEETDLRANKTAYNRIKDWVTSRELSIHPKGGTPYHIPNTTHYIQCANPREACPVFAGDTRVTMIFVPQIKDMIPKRQMMISLEKEAPDFLASILDLELPSPADRLNIPALDTDDKLMAINQSRSALEIFLADTCMEASGQYVELAHFYNKFIEYCDPVESKNWSKIRVGREIPLPYLRGRLRQSNKVIIGNMAFIDENKGPLTFKYTRGSGEQLDTTPI